MSKFKLNDLVMYNTANARIIHKVIKVSDYDDTIIITQLSYKDLDTWAVRTDFIRLATELEISNYMAELLCLN